MRKLIVFALCFFGLILFIVINYIEQDSSLKVKVSMEGSIFKKVQFIQKKEERINLNVYSEEIFMSEDGKYMELREISILFPEREFKVLAQRGFYYPKDGNLSLKENVIATTKNFTIWTDEAHWDFKSKLLFSEKPVRIDGENFIIEGNTGKANEDLIELKRGVKAIIYAKKKN